MAEGDSCGKVINSEHNLEYTGREVIMGSSPDIFGFQFRSNDHPPNTSIWWVTGDKLKGIHDQISFMLNLPRSN